MILSTDRSRSRWAEKGETKDTLVEMLRTVPKAFSKPFIRRSVISDDEKWFQTYLTDIFGFVNNCHFGRVLDNGLIDRARVLVERHETCEKEQ